MIFRFNSKDGRFRTDDFNASEVDLPTLIKSQLLDKLPAGTIFGSIQVSQGLNPGGNNARPIDEFENRNLDSFNFRNGEMFYLTYDIDESLVKELDSVSLSNTTNSTTKGQKTIKTHSQLPLDDELDKLEGLIPRKRSLLCKHTEKGMCEYCSPLPPYDESYHEEHNIKHISFHAYVKSLNDQMNRKDSPTSFIPPLEEPSYVKDPNCPNHAPNQICSKCQPSLITLQQQKFRMVDHVEISNPLMVNEFINTWRKSGLQRIGIMVGKYERYDEVVPLGIKLRVELIYELPQLDDIDGVVLDLELYEKQLDNVTKLSSVWGLQPVGFIFTDLTDSGLGNQTVLCKRHKDSFFLSSLEVLFLARQQCRNPNYTKWSASGKFSSKFITCCVTGNDKGEIDIFLYQVSNSAEKLVELDLITGSTHPSCVFIKEQDKDYVPEIFYNKINEYGRQVKQNAKPWFPVEYLLVTLTHGFPKNEQGENSSAEGSKILFPKISNFPIENRNYIHEIQEVTQCAALLGINTSTGEYDLLKLGENLSSNFHLIYYLLFELELLNDDLKNTILQIIGDGKDELVLYKLLENESWNTMLAILMAH